MGRYFKIRQYTIKSTKFKKKIVKRYAFNSKLSIQFLITGPHRNCLIELSIHVFDMYLIYIWLEFVKTNKVCSKAHKISSFLFEKYYIQFRPISSKLPTISLKLCFLFAPFIHNEIINACSNINESMLYGLFIQFMSQKKLSAFQALYL